MSEVETQTAEHMIKVFQLLLMTDKPNITDDEVEKIIVDLGGEDAAMEVLTKAISTQVGDTEDRP
jgi:t-SNARE complex subunit (syntaxin)